MFERKTLCFLILFCGLSAAGCQQHARYSDYAAFVREPRPSVVGDAYRLGVPDKVVVTRWSVRGVEESAHTLGPDGTLWLPGLDPVPAAGKTCREIAQALQAQLRSQPGATDAGPDQAPTASVRVSEFASQKVFVFGQVARRGEQPFHGANTLMQTLAHAQPSARAQTDHVQVLRPSADGEYRRRLTVDLDAITKRGDSTLDVVLEAGDVVYVPPTPLGAVGIAWDSVFGPARPGDHDHTPADAPNRRTDLDTQRELERLQESLSLWNHQVRALEQSHTRLTQTLERAALRPLAPAPAVPTAAIETQPTPDPTSPPKDAIEFTSADVPRGGAGESPRPDGVRFWGP